jgi:hypothetical protein
MKLEYPVNIDATLERIWAMLADVERWPEWTASMRKVEIIGGGVLGAGQPVRVEQPRLPKTVWLVTDFESGREFAWVAGAPGLKTIASHQIEPLPAGRRDSDADDRPDRSARLALFALTTSLTRRYVNMEAQGLKRRAEAGWVLAAGIFFSALATRRCATWKTGFEPQRLARWCLVLAGGALSPPAELVGPALELTALAPRFAQAFQVAAAEGDGDAFDFVATKFLDGDFLAGRVGAPKAARVRQRSTPRARAPLSAHPYYHPRPLALETAAVPGRGRRRNMTPNGANHRGDRRRFFE